MCIQYYFTLYLFIAGLAITKNSLRGDTIISNDGEVLKGRILKEEPMMITFESKLAGTVAIATADIEKIVKDPVADKPQNFESLLASLKVPLEKASDEEYDWIQLTSGEWLKGSIKAMYSNSLEFESDELDDQELDWEDVSRILSAKEFSVRIDKTTTRVGRLAMIGGQLSIDDDPNAKVEQFELISIAPDGSSELDSWSSKISLSSSYRSGTSEQRDISLNGSIQKRTSFRRLYLDFLSNYSLSNNETTSNDFRMNTYFDSFRTKRIFIRPVSLEYYRDPLQNIGKRYTLAASLGYHIIDNRETTWDVTFGPALQRAEYIDVLESDSQQENDPAILLTSQFDTELTKKLDLKGSYKIQYANTTGGLTFHAWTKFEFELSKLIDLELTFLWDRIENPVVTGNGVIPGNDDIRTTFGIGIEL